jgi:hypothetical protein
MAESQRPLADRVRAAIAGVVGGEAPDPQRVGAVAARLDVLPRYYDWTAFGAVRPDGEPVWVEYEAPHAVEPIADPVHWNLVLHAAAERYPSLADLRPVRPAGAPDCPACDGTGVCRIEGVAMPQVTCSCGDTGWLP